MKQLFDQIIKFGIVGVICFFIDFGITAGLANFFGVHYLISKFLGFVISCVVNYLLSSNASHDILVYGGHHAKAAAMNISLHFSSFDYLVYIAYIVLLVIVNMTVVNNQIKKYSPRELLSGE